MKKKTGYIGFVLTLAAFLIPAPRAQAGEWQVSIQSSGNGCMTEYRIDGDTETVPYDWHVLNMPPFLVGVASLQMDTYTAATATLSETFTITLTWVDANGAPPPAHLNYLISGRSSWNGLPQINLFHPSALHIDGSRCYASDGLQDPYVGEYLSTNDASGASQGTHLFKVDNPGTTVTKTVTMTIDCSWPATNFDYYTNFGNSISVCLLTHLDPYPDEIARTNPVVFYHGTDRDTADSIVAGLDLEARGSADFGKGFYTATDVGATSPRGFSGTGLLLAENTGWRRVRNLQKKKPDGSLDLRWGVVEFDVPLTDMLNFFCDYQNLIVGFNEEGTNAVPPWNALPSPGRNSPYDNNPIPLAEGDPMNWFNFSWFNWYAYRCTTSRPFTNDEGTEDYIPDWEPDDFDLLPDWHRALIWGRLYAPASSCTGGPGRTMPPGAEYDSRNGGYGLNQYVWGTGGGLGFLNGNVSIVRKLATSGETNPNP